MSLALFVKNMLSLNTKKNKDVNFYFDENIQEIKF